MSKNLNIRATAATGYLCHPRLNFLTDHAVGLWKLIRKEWASFHSRACSSLEDRQRMRFWDDVWYG